MENRFPLGRTFVFPAAAGGAVLGGGCAGGLLLCTEMGLSDGAHARN